VFVTSAGVTLKMYSTPSPSTPSSPQTAHLIGLLQAPQEPSDCFVLTQVTSIDQVSPSIPKGLSVHLLLQISSLVGGTTSVSVTSSGLSDKYSTSCWKLPSFEINLYINSVVSPSVPFIPSSPVILIGADHSLRSVPKPSNDPDVSQMYFPDTSSAFVFQTLPSITVISFVSGFQEISELLGVLGVSILLSVAVNIKIVLPPPSFPSLPYLAHTVGFE